MNRVLAEAAEMGAHGVIGMNLTLRPAGETRQVIEFTVVGTAVRRAGAAPLPFPFTCHLSGQDLTKLLRVGYMPVAFVLGISVVETWIGCTTDYQLRSWTGAEVTQMSEAIETSRMGAAEHLETQAARVADGVIGVETRFSEMEMGERAQLVQTIATGTAVRRFHNEPPLEPSLVMIRLWDRTDQDQI